MSAADLRPLPDDWARALAVVAHPDDLEYGLSLRRHDGLAAGTVGTDPDAFLRGRAEQVGARFGGRLAVAFELIEL